MMSEKIDDKQSLYNDMGIPNLAVGKGSKTVGFLEHLKRCGLLQFGILGKCGMSQNTKLPLTENHRLCPEALNSSHILSLFIVGYCAGYVSRPQAD